MITPSGNNTQVLYYTLRKKVGPKQPGAVFEMVPHKLCEVEVWKIQQLQGWSHFFSVYMLESSPCILHVYWLGLALHFSSALSTHGIRFPFYFQS